jgi:hypothetical protein
MKEATHIGMLSTVKDCGNVRYVSRDWRNEMAKFNITLSETQTTEFELEATDVDEAKDLAYQMWENGELGYAGLEVEIEAEVL